MARPVDFAGSNMTLKAAPGTEAIVSDMRVHANGQEYISRWKLTDEERRVVAETGDVWLSIAGKTVPPSFVSGLPLMAFLDDAGNVMDKYDPDAMMEV